MPRRMSHCVLPNTLVPLPVCPWCILQGALDPLNDARSRAKQLGELCPNVQVELLEAGRCRVGLVVGVG